MTIKPANVSQIAVAVVVCLSVLSSAGTAGTLSLESDQLGGTPLSLQAGETSSPIQIRVVNDLASDPPQDLLTGWQVRLQLLPHSGSGQVEFDTAQPGTGSDAPGDYVFAGGSSFGITVNNSGSVATALDFLNSLLSGGVQVPSGSGAGLFGVAIHASSSAQGTFGVYAVAGEALTEWTDSASPFQQTRAFGNVPFGGDSVLLGEVSVQRVPEPLGVQLAMMAGALVAGARRRRFSCEMRSSELPS